MGNRSSAAAPVISPAEARAHLSDEEFNRLQNAFGSIKKSQLNVDDFAKHVLGGANVPEDARMALFKFFSCGGNTISFDNLICALVGICRIEDVQTNFIEEHREFVSWGLRPPQLTIPVNDAYISFYEVMSYVTHLSVKEVTELETVFLKLSVGGVKLLPQHWLAAARGCFPPSFLKRLFVVFDENKDGEVDFREMVCGVSAMCRGPRPARLSFIGKLWDEDGDNKLSIKELNSLYDELNVPAESRTVALSGGAGTMAAMVDFAAWATEKKNQGYVDRVYAMAHEIGHICFGLRPESPDVEFEVIESFEKRIQECSSQVEEWNILSAKWLHQWGEALTGACGGSPKTHYEARPPIDNSSLLSPVEPFPGSSKLPCLSSDSSWLRRDLTSMEWVAVPHCLFNALARWYGYVRPTDEILRRRSSWECDGDDSSSIELYPLLVVFERRRPLPPGQPQPSLAGTTTQQPGIAHNIYSWAYAQASRRATVSQLLALCCHELRVAEVDVRLWLSSSRPASPSPSLSSASSSDRISSLTAPLSCLSLPSSGNTPATSSGYITATTSSVSTSTTPSFCGGGASLLDEPLQSLADLLVGDGSSPIRMLVEVRDRSTRVWPEEARIARTGETIAQASARGAAVGLVNYGNFCYRNAAVQCLARVAPLTNFLLEKENDFPALAAKKKDKKAVSTSLHFVKLIREMTTSSKKNISPIHFNEAIKETRAFDGAEQHDCEEFVSFLLSQLHYTLREGEPTILKENGLSKEKREEEEAKEDTLDDDTKSRIAWQRHNSEESSLVTRLFSGQLRSSLFCSRCGASSSTFDVFTALPVPIGFERVELYEVFVVRRDASIPLRHGVRVPRDSATATLKAAIAAAAGLQPQLLKLIRISKNDSNRLAELRDKEVLGRPVQTTQIFALELAEPEGGEEGRKCFPAVHRRMKMNRDAYLLGAASGRSVSLFGVPIPVNAKLGPETTSLSLYEDVWRQLSRFICNPPPSFANRALDPCENASAGYPFTLSLVDSSLEWCATCPALRFCRGCPLRTDAAEKRLTAEGIAAIAVDWQPIALYLKYNHSPALSFVDAPSLAALREQHAKPSSLSACLRNFASPEQLDDAIECKKCQEKTHREKVMSIWRLPRYLIIQLKRFEYVVEEGRIGKCKREVDFPLNAFDASPFLGRPHGMSSGSPGPLLLYDCIAIASHYGELQAGHFVAYARSKGGSWLLLNDCTVRDVTEYQVDKAAAYLLFYERRGAEAAEGGVDAGHEGDIAFMDEDEGDSVSHL